MLLIDSCLQFDRLISIGSEEIRLPSPSVWLYVAHEVGWFIRRANLHGSELPKLGLGRVREYVETEFEDGHYLSKKYFYTCKITSGWT
jgi:hypothetical protein